MDTSEILAAIVEQACLYVPDVSVGAPKAKRPKKAFSDELKVPNEALSKVESPIETLTSAVKVPVAASNLVRSKLFELACFKVIVCQLVLFGLICNL